MRRWLPALLIPIALAGCGVGLTKPALTPALQSLRSQVLGPGGLARELAGRTQMGTGALLPAAAPAAAPTRTLQAALPAATDLRAAMPPVYHQGPFMSCTAFAVAKGLGEYLLRRKGDLTPLSAAHFYAMSNELSAIIDADAALPEAIARELTVNDMKRGFDEGRSLAAAMVSLEWAGAVPESENSYPGPDAWRSYADRLAAGPESDETRQALRRWFTLDLRSDVKRKRIVPVGHHRYKLKIQQAAPARDLPAVKRALARQMPVALGVWLHEGAYSAQTTRTGWLAPPAPGEREVGGHAMLAVGYDDAKAAVCVRNSWGPGWGEAGYGWLPYAAFEAGLVRDGWTVARE